MGRGVTTLAGMISAYPTPAAGTVITTANSVSMGNLHGSAGCGALSCTQERLRATFSASGTATLFLCDINTPSGEVSNCTAAGSATSARVLAADGLTPIMSFPGMPATAGIQTFTRVFVQRDGHVYQGFQDKPSTSTQTRLNKLAFEVLAAALGIQAPTIPAHPSPAAGFWNVGYTGGDSGS